MIGTRRWLSFGTFYLALLCAAAVAAVTHGARTPGAVTHGARTPGAPGSVSERKDFKETLRFGAGTTRRVDIDNYAGPVSIVGEDRDDVELTVSEVITADSADLLATARRDVTLERSQDGATVRVSACGPWTEHEGRGRGCCFHGWERLGYKVEYSISARVPRSVTLLASTVDDGDVHVEGVRGALRIENVNGSVSAHGVAGGGVFGTVNGNLEVWFAANPTAPSSFSNVNGDIDVEFRPGLAADVRLKTLNGEMWSDFEYASLPMLGRVDKQQGRFVYTNNHTAALRIAGGGPELRFETVNGEIRLRRNGK